MSSYWNNLFFRLEAALDRLILAAKRRSNTLREPVILPYRGYGDRDIFHVSGRVLEAGKIIRSHAQDSAWKNFKDSFRRFVTVEIPGVKVRLQFNGIQLQAVSDSGGYFRFRFAPGSDLNPHAQWHTITLSLPDATSSSSDGQCTVSTEVLTPPADADFGIISDIDDTILQTRVLKRLKMVSLTLFKNAHTRLAYDGTANFYRALQKGPSGQNRNPVFYVSQSMWNLYDLLTEFMALNHLPKGPLFLRSPGRDSRTSRKQEPHFFKRSRIEKILAVYPGMPFILIGDSGQGDPELYQDIAEKFPGRILAIYIRDIGNDSRDTRIVDLASCIRSPRPLEMVLARDTCVAVDHAARNGWIAPVNNETKMAAS